jgi:hypothetical protein
MCHDKSFQNGGFLLKKILCTEIYILVTSFLAFKQN